MSLGSLMNGNCHMLPDLSELPLNLSENGAEHGKCLSWNHLSIPSLVLSPDVVYGGHQHLVEVA
jgi:hypothetical protein